MVATGGTMPVKANAVTEDASAMKVVNEQQEDNQMIREINEEDTVPLAALQNVGDVLVNEPLNDSQPDDGEEEKRDVVKMNTDDSVLSSHVNATGQIQPSQQEMPSDDDLETYRIVFELFDRDRSGFIDNHDLAAISVKLGRDPSEGKFTCALFLII